jgi:hypothetical protein
VGLVGLHHAYGMMKSGCCTRKVYGFRELASLRCHSARTIRRRCSRRSRHRSISHSHPARCASSGSNGFRSCSRSHSFIRQFHASSGSNGLRAIGAPGKRTARRPARKVSGETRLSASGLPTRTPRLNGPDANRQQVVPPTLDMGSRTRF